MNGTTVSIIVDPKGAVTLSEIVSRGPVWIAATQENRAAAERLWREHPTTSDRHEVTTFQVDPTDTPADWCADVLPVVDLHFGAYDDNPPTYEALEVYGAAPTQELLEMLAETGYVCVLPRANGFRASRFSAAV
jgi:hypothetical protein